MPRKPKEYPDQATLKRDFSYDPESGIFTCNSNPELAVGYVPKLGYLMIHAYGNTYYGHRLAFLYMTGKVPECVDHVDQNRANNTWSNLRSCTHSQNLANRGVQKNSKSGFKGVYLCKRRNRWLAQLTVRGKQMKLGSFQTPEDASAAYQKAATKYFGEFAKS